MIEAIVNKGPELWFATMLIVCSFWGFWLFINIPDTRVGFISIIVIVVFGISLMSCLILYRSKLIRENVIQKSSIEKTIVVQYLYLHNTQS
jgi:hypothetical protein